MKKDSGRYRKCLALMMTVVTLSGLTLAACGDKQSADDMKDSEQTEQTDAAADKEQASESVFGTFTSVSLDGTEVTQDIFAEADLSLVNVWGTFCGPCIREMPELGEISREYKEKGVQVVGMLCDVAKAGDETALEIVEATGADYTHIVLSQDLQSGFLGRVQAVPTTIFVDSDGNQVGEICTGARSKADFISMIEEALSEVH